MPDGLTYSRRVLEPNERIAEVLFGLIMVLTFTGSLSIAEADRAEVRTMFIGALGCNTVWGIIDGVLYLMGCLNDKGRGLMIFRAVRRAADPQTAHHLIADALPSVVAAVLEPAELEAVRLRLRQLPEPPNRARLHKDDWLGDSTIVFAKAIPDRSASISMPDSITRTSSPASWRITTNRGQPPRSPVTFIKRRPSSPTCLPAFASSTRGNSKAVRNASRPISCEARANPSMRH